MALLSAWPAGAIQRPPPTFAAIPIDGEPLRGKLVRVEAPWTFVFAAQGQDGETPLSANDLYLMKSAGSGSRFPGAPIARHEPRVVLANGDSVLAHVERTAQEQVRVRSRMFGQIALPWEAVSALMLRPGDGGRIGRPADLPTDADVLALTNGDTVAGTILSIGDRQIELDSTVGKIEVSRSGVASVFFNPELTHLPKPEGLHALVWLSDGSRLTATSLGWSESGRVLLETSYSLRVEVEPSAIEKMQFLGGRLVYLSDLGPESYEHTPLLSVVWPYERDRSVSGNPLQLDGTVYAKGLGMHSASRLAYTLDGRYQRFAATLGVDDETRGDGSVVFRVIVDGQECYASSVLRGTDEPIKLEPINVGGAQTLELVVERADYGDVQDHADWADARLVRD